MSRLIDKGLEQLERMLIHMGELAHKTVSLSLENYIKNLGDYSQVRNQSDTLVLMAEGAEDKAFELIARFQPVASDLRVLKSYMRIIYDLVRYGRYALDVSQIHERLGGLEKCEGWIKNLVREMSNKVLEMVHMSINSIIKQDVELAKALSEIEKQVDDLYFKYLDILVKRAPTIDRYTVSSVLVVRYLERIADHATYIGESVVYLATGEKLTLR
ncbi:MAG: phosphate signaling complex protein PhoU [Candidatus Bathyarchaeia archaeon]